MDLRQYLEKISPTSVNRDSQGMLHPPYPLKSISTSRLFTLREGGPVFSLWNRASRAPTRRAALHHRAMTELGPEQRARHQVDADLEAALEQFAPFVEDLKG